MNYVIEIFSPISQFTSISLSLLLPQFLFSICLFYLPLLQEISSSTFFPRDTASPIISFYLSPTITSFLYCFFFLVILNSFFMNCYLRVILQYPHSFCGYDTHLIGTIKCDISTIICDVGTIQCDIGTI